MKHGFNQPVASFGTAVSRSPDRSLFWASIADFHPASVFNPCSSVAESDCIVPAEAGL